MAGVMVIAVLVGLLGCGKTQDIQESEPVEYTCEFVPQELILAAEEFLCKVSENESQSFFYEGDEFMAFGARFGSDELKLSAEDIYELFPGVYEHREEIEDIYEAHDFLAPELEMHECCDAYGYLLDGHEYYVFVCPCGGSSPLCFVLCLENGEVNTIHQSIAIPNRVFSFIEREQYHYM